MSHLKIPSYRGKPVITSGMKAKFIGEYAVPFDVIDPNTEIHLTLPVQVPWDIIKDIYKDMALFASSYPEVGGEEYTGKDLLAAWEADNET